MSFHDRHYVIVPSGAIHTIDFNEVMETSKDTVRFSVDGTQTFVKYKGDVPPSVASIPDKSVEYDHPDILDILSTEAWSPTGVI